MNGSCVNHQTGHAVDVSCANHNTGHAVGFNLADHHWPAASASAYPPSTLGGPSRSASVYPPSMVGHESAYSTDITTQEVSWGEEPRCPEDTLPIRMADKPVKCNLCSACATEPTPITVGADAAALIPWGYYKPVKETVNGVIKPAIYRIPSGTVCMICRNVWSNLGWQHQGLGTIQHYGKEVGRPGSKAAKEHQAFMAGRQTYIDDINKGKVARPNSPRGDGTRRRVRRDSKKSAQEDAKTTLDHVKRSGFADKTAAMEFVEEAFLG